MTLGKPHLDAWRSVILAHSSITGTVEEALREADLPPLSWLNALWALDEAPGKRLRMNELALHLNLSRGGLTKLVDRLQAAGLIDREPCPMDRRGYHAVLLPTGADTLARMWPIYEAELGRILGASVSEEEAETIGNALRRATESACTLVDESAPAPPEAVRSG